MRRLISYGVLVMMGLIISISSIAQSTTVTGSVKNNKSKESVSAVSVTVKGGTAGTFTDDNGNFKLTTTQKPPFTLVFSSVGFKSKEVAVTGNNQAIDVNLDVSYTIGEEITVSASRVPERILESPVTIERIGAAAIRQAPAPSYYEMLGNLKGVDVVSSSLTFKSVGTRGFNVNGNLRLNQIVDGMDNQAPGLNFSVGNIVGLTELDVESMELLPGASSALYGSGGMNGTVIINSKDPFKYQGLSYQIKEGVNHIDSYQRPLNSFHDWSVRWSQKVSDKFAFKIGAQMVQAQDWLANDQRDFNRTTNTIVPGGNRANDPNYDGINVYGDETTANLQGVTNSVLSSISAAIGAPTYNALYGASSAYLSANPGASLSQYNTFLNGIGGASLVAGGYSPFFFGNFRQYFAPSNVSRTGYNESDVINPTTLNVKLTGAAFYKINDNLTASVTANYGTGSSVYTGSDRYALKNLRMGQYKLELKSKNWYLRWYTTQENSGDSYNATIAARYFNEAWSPSSTWYPTYASAYVQGIAAGLSSLQAHANARSVADANRPNGPIYNNPLFQQIVSTPISQGGAKFLDKTALYNWEGQYNLTEALGLAKTKTELIVGGNLKKYVLNSQGTLFADTSGTIPINETGAYFEVRQRLLNDVLKLSFSGRYDKNTNFDGRFTPRASLVIKVSEDQHFRFSYQNAYRFPSTQNQWIDLLVGGGTRLLGGLPQLRDAYGFGPNNASNPLYTQASFQTFAATGNPAVLQQQTFGAFKAESSTSYEIGYKGLFGKVFLLDAYFYWGQYNNFISSVNGVQSKNGTIAGLATGYTVYSVSVTDPTPVSTNGWGISAEYLLPHNFSVTGNLYSDQIGALPSGFVSYFNTAKYRANVGFSNSGFLDHNRIGFGVVYKYQDVMNYEGTFATGHVPSFGTVDAMISYKIPNLKSLVKIGASNFFNSYYTNGMGNAQVGGLYYISFGYNVF